MKATHDFGSLGAWIRCTICEVRPGGVRLDCCGCLRHSRAPDPIYLVMAEGHIGYILAAMAYIYWNVRPEIFQLGPLTVRWYGLLFALLFAIGYAIGRWQFRIEHKDPQTVDSLLVYLIVGTIVGARLGHCLFYEPGYYLHHPLEIPQVWKGGLASHGGAIGVMVALYLYARRHPDQPMLWLLDRVALATALGGSLIRLGNLFNSEILGQPTQVPWAFVFARVDAIPRHPAQLYESIAYLFVFIGLMWIYWRLRGATPHGLLTGIFFVTVFVFRFLIEFIKERQADYEQRFPLSVGQLLSIPFIIAGVVLIKRAWAKRTETTPGNRTAEVSKTTRSTGAS